MYENFDISKIKKIGTNVLIHSFVSITRPELLSLGNHVSIDPFFHCTTALETKDYVHIQSHVSIIGGKKGLLRLGNFTNISTGGKIICASERFYGEGLIAVHGIPDEFLDEYKSGPIIFEDFVNTGANITILPGVTLAEGSVIGACSLITENTEPWTIYAGIPAKPIASRKKEKMLEYARKLGYDK
jgi:galactoside O-acetyltransferase